MPINSFAPLSILCIASLSLAARAQSTTHSLTIGGSGARGCQGPEDPPLLSNGTLATATLDLSYDATTRVLELVLANTSPVTPGVPNPLITEVAFNLPHGAVSGVTLLGQTGSGGATPAFALQVDANAFVPPNLSVACLGDFGAILADRNSSGGIANPRADTFAVPPGHVIIGPATFRLLLAGPGVSSLSAQAIGVGISRFAPAHQVNAECKFHGGGVGGTGGGYISSTVDPSCQPSGWLGGAPRIGTTTSICLNGHPSCVGCFFGSLFPGPSIFGPFRIPVGLPLLFDVFVPPLPQNAAFCFPLDVPPDRNLIGRTLYVALATPGTTLDDVLDFSPRVNVTFIE